MIPTRARVGSPRWDQRVPLFWPFAGAIEFGEDGRHLFERNLEFLAEAKALAVPPEPEWATPNRVLLDLDTMRLREFVPADAPRRVG